MKKEIKIDIEDRDDLLEKFNENKVSREVIDYIIREAMIIEKDKEIEIVINKGKAIVAEECKELIKKGLKDEYKRSLEIQRENNIKQLYFLVLGAILLFLSIKIKQVGILKEILLISGWVPIWEMVKIELFPDVQERIKRKCINRLLKSEIIERI